MNGTLNAATGPDIIAADAQAVVRYMGCEPLYQSIRLASIN